MRITVVDDGLRFRRSAPNHQYYYSAIGGKSTKQGEKNRFRDECGSIGMSASLGIYPAIAFVVAFVGYVITGVVCIWTPPVAQIAVVSHTVPSEKSTCFRATRRADYTLLELAVGSPPRLLNVLFRIGSVVHDAADSIHLWSERLIESSSLYCGTAVNHTCVDVILVARGSPTNHLSRVAYEFRYDLSSAVPQWYEPRALGAEGEIFPVVGYTYYMTSTHLCMAEVSNDNDAPELGRQNTLVARIGPVAYSSGYEIDYYPLLTTGNNTLSVADQYLGQAEVRRAALEDACREELKTVRLFPLQSTNNGGYLAISDPYLYDAEPEQVALRRSVVELGYVCANERVDFFSTSAYSDKDTFGIDSAINLYEFDTHREAQWNAPSQSMRDWQRHWRDLPSLSFRRVSRLDIVAHYGRDRVATFELDHNEALASLPALSSMESAIWFAVMKLLTLLLAAAVVWVRNDRNTSSARWLYRHTLHVAYGAPSISASTSTNAASASILEDAFLGLLAATTRCAISIIRLPALVADNQGRVCYVNIVASVVSLCNWSVRFVGIHPNIFNFVSGDVGPDEPSPLSRLGGSMAIVDATCAVLLAFAEPPIMDALSTFDDTARVLTGLLLNLITFHRCLYSTACNALLYEACNKAHSAWEYIVAASAAMWVVQIIAIAISMADIVVIPLATSMTRTVAGQDTVITLALFLASVCVAIPRLLRTTNAMANCNASRETAEDEGE